MAENLLAAGEYCHKRDRDLSLNYPSFGLLDVGTGFRHGLRLKIDALIERLFIRPVALPLSLQSYRLE